MDLLIRIFGEGDKLSTLQMAARGIAIFITALILIRLSGRRSFGMHMPLDNVITILLGAILSRAVVGASPFVPIVATCTAVALLYRFCNTFAFYNKTFGKIVKGKEFILYANGRLYEENMRRYMVSKEDLIERIRLNANVDSLEETACVYMERTGQISVVKKDGTSPQP